MHQALAKDSQQGNSHEHVPIATPRVDAIIHLVARGPHRELKGQQTVPDTSNCTQRKHLGKVKPNPRGKNTLEIDPESSQVRGKLSVHSKQHDRKSCNATR